MILGKSSINLAVRMVPISSGYIFPKWFDVAFLMLTKYFMVLFSFFISDILFRHFLAWACLWKKEELKSPALSHRLFDLSLQNSSSASHALWNLCSSRFSLSNSSLVISAASRWRWWCSNSFWIFFFYPLQDLAMSLPNLSAFFWSYEVFPPIQRRGTPWPALSISF